MMAVSDERLVKRISDEQLADFIEVRRRISLCPPQDEWTSVLLELRERRGQTCETCAAWELFSDDPVFSADEKLWCAELERFKPAEGYCDEWKLKEAK